MKALRVVYKTTANEIDSEVLLVSEGENLEKLLSEKTGNYQTGNAFCEILVDIELPLSMVKIGDLSVIEFMLMTQAEA